MLQVGKDDHALAALSKTRYAFMGRRVGGWERHVSKKFVIILVMASGLALASCETTAPVNDCVHSTFCDQNGRPL
jgi:hypothetical protein